MKRLKLLLLTCLLCFPFGVLAKAESCNYQDGTGSTVVSAVTDDGFLAPAVVKVTSFNGEKFADDKAPSASKQTNSPQQLTKCWKYMRIIKLESYNTSGVYTYQVSDDASKLQGVAKNLGVLLTKYDKVDTSGTGDAANDPNGNIEVTDVGFCDPVQSNGVLKAFQVIGYIIYVAKFLIPLLLIIFGSIDFAKAIISSSDKAGSEAISSFVKRVVAAVIIFFVPTIISFVLDLIDDASATINDENFTNCKTCLFDPLSKECLAQNIVDDK